MSLTFTMRCPNVTPAQVLGAIPDAVAVGSIPDFERPFPSTPTRVGQPGVTTRPVEVWADEGKLHVRLLTNGACPATSKLGVALISAAARAARVEVTDEEGRTWSADGFREKYDDQWCTEHARFGLNAMSQAMTQHPRGWAVMPTFDGYLTVRPARYKETERGMEYFECFRKRAWISQYAPAAETLSVVIGAEIGRPVEVQASIIDLSTRCWVDNTSAWSVVAGLDGIVPMAELVDAYGQHAELIDDGCVVLHGLGADARERALTAIRAAAITDLGVLENVAKLPKTSPGTLLADLELRSASTSLVHPEHARELLRERVAGRTRVERWDTASASALPLPVRRALALAPLRAALAVAGADGQVDLREKFAIFASARGQEEGPMKVLWAATFEPEDESWSEALSGDVVAALYASIQIVDQFVAPGARKIWCDGILKRANATANASGGLLGLFGSRVGPEEVEVLGFLENVLAKVMSLP